MDLENFRGGTDLLPRYLLLEPLLKGRRVLEVGALGPIGTDGAAARADHDSHERTGW
jgi:hypothetical protein